MARIMDANICPLAYTTRDNALVLEALRAACREQ